MRRSTQKKYAAFLIQNEGKTMGKPDWVKECAKHTISITIPYYLIKIGVMRKVDESLFQLSTKGHYIMPIVKKLGQLTMESNKKLTERILSTKHKPAQQSHSVVPENGMTAISNAEKHVAALRSLGFEVTCRRIIEL